MWLQRYFKPDELVVERRDGLAVAVRFCAAVPLVGRRRGVVRIDTAKRMRPVRADGRLQQPGG